MSRAKHRSQLGALGEINITPLLDLAFLLLLVFMITMPLLEYGVNVSPPKANMDPLPEKKDHKVINIDNKGKIEFQKRMVTYSQLIEDLKSLKSMDEKLSVLVRADGERPYKEVIEVMKCVRGAGITSVSLVTQAEK